MNAIPVSAENPTVEERSTQITLGGQAYDLILTTLATKLIARRYGGLENLGEKLSKTEHFEDALDEIIYLITLLANQSVMIHNLWHPDDKRQHLTEEAVELLSTPYDLTEYKNAIVAALYKGTKRHVESEESDAKNAETAE